VKPCDAAVKPCDATMVRGGNGAQVNAARARSSVREDRPAMSLSIDPTNVPSHQTVFHGAT